MFDNGFLSEYFAQFKSVQISTLRNLIDVALDTRDREWFNELSERLAKLYE